MVSERILVVDDEEEVLGLFSHFLERDGYEVETANSASNAMSLVEANPFRAAFLDLNLPDYNGIELLKNIKKADPDTVGIVVTGYGSIETAVEAMSCGAYHYLTKPVKINEVRSLLTKALVNGRSEIGGREARQRPKLLLGVEEVVGESEAMQKVFKLISKVADTESIILIHGESGTGKELVARTIHLNSRRRGGPYVPVNCGAIPETLLESELFGHEKGAFTGANATRLGRFELAHGGTIFLDSH